MGGLSKCQPHTNRGSWKCHIKGITRALREWKGNKMKLLVRLIYISVTFCFTFLNFHIERCYPQIANQRFHMVKWNNVDIAWKISQAVQRSILRAFPAKPGHCFCCSPLAFVFNTCLFREKHTIQCIFNTGDAVVMVSATELSRRSLRCVHGQNSLLSQYLSPPGCKHWVLVILWEKWWG